MGPPVTHLRTTDTENFGGKDQQPVFIKLSKSLQQWLEIKSIMQGIYIQSKTQYIPFRKFSLKVTYKLILF